MENPPSKLPRVTIEFCTQCKWMLRAAYFAQELLSTFSTSLGEVALQPSTGGTFVVRLYTTPSPISTASNEPVEIQQHLLWDRKAEGGFPEVKELKRRVRDVIDPNRSLGHVDGHKASTEQPQSATTSEPISSSEQEQGQAIPRAINRLLAPTQAERKFTPMDVDPKEEKEVLNSRGKIVIGGAGGDGDGGSFGFCRPGDEDCG